MVLRGINREILCHAPRRNIAQVLGLNEKNIQLESEDFWTDIQRLARARRIYAAPNKTKLLKPTYLPFSYHYQGSIHFNTVNIHPTVGMYFFVSRDHNIQYTPCSRECMYQYCP